MLLVEGFVQTKSFTSWLVEGMVGSSPTHQLTKGMEGMHGWGDQPSLAKGFAQSTLMQPAGQFTRRLISCDFDIK
jgi:hypothetical protein